MQQKTFDQMTRQATYNAQANSLTELPAMEKPVIPEVNNSHVWCAYYNRLTRYEKHIATLRTIPCSPECRGLWKEGQVLEENRDYKLFKNCAVPGGCDNDLTCPTCDYLAFPLPVKSEDQDEVWASAMDLYMVAKSLYPFSPEKWFSVVKEKYIITKR